MKDVLTKITILLISVGSLINAYRIDELRTEVKQLKIEQLK